MKVKDLRELLTTDMDELDVLVYNEEFDDYHEVGVATTTSISVVEQKWSGISLYATAGLCRGEQVREVYPAFVIER